MFKRILLVLIAVLFLSKLSFAELTTYELVGTVKSSKHSNVVKSVKSALTKDFKIIGLVNPANNKNLTVLMLENKAFFDGVNKAGRYAFFAVPLRVGIQQDGNANKVMFANPVYLVDAFAKGKNKLKKAAEATKKLLEKDLIT